MENHLQTKCKLMAWSKKKAPWGLDLHFNGHRLATANEQHGNIQSDDRGQGHSEHQSLQ